MTDDIAYSKGTMHILGNRIDYFPSYRSLYGYVLSDVRKNRRRGYITVNNVHTMMEGFWHSDFRKCLNESYLSIPDGKPLQVVGRLKNANGIVRLFGPTVMEKFLNWGRKDKIRHFFIGGTPDFLGKLKEEALTRYPGAEIVGSIAPPFSPMDKWPVFEYINQINDAKPDLIWVGLGAPKQEKWMNQYASLIDNGILIGIGAGFSYLAGNTKHAPEWMKNASLEWLFRLAQEPKRLFRRYFTTIPPFLVLASLDVMRFKIRQFGRYLNIYRSG